MDVRYSEELSQAFVVSPTDLKKLVELLQKRIGKVDISADCIDKIEREFDTIKDLIAYENSKSKRICRIHLSARSDNYSKSAAIVFRDPSWLISGVSINVNGREDVVSRLKEEIRDIVAGMRPWYDVFARIDLGTIISIGFLILLVVLSIFILFEWIPVSDSTSSDSDNAKGSAFSIVFLVITSLGLWGFYRLRRILFPRAVFTIGQGESRFRILETVHWGVVIAFFVSLAAGLVLLIFK